MTEVFDQPAQLGYTGKIMDNSSPEDQTPNKADIGGSEFLPHTFEEQQKVDQLANRLKSEGQISTAPINKIAAAQGLSLSQISPPEVRDEPPMAIPNPTPKPELVASTPARARGFGATLARVAFPLLTLFGVVHAPDAQQAAANAAASAQQGITQNVESAQRTLSELGASANKGGTPPSHLEAGPSMQAAVPGPLDKDKAVYAAPAPISLPNK